MYTAEFQKVFVQLIIMLLLFRLKMGDNPWNVADATMFLKVEKILKGSLDLIPSPSVKIQIMGGRVCLMCKGKTLLGVVNKLLKTKKLLHPAMFCLITSSKVSGQ